MLVVVQDVLEALKQHGATLAVAEGDTGGVLLAELTARPGSSAVVLGGVVAYHDDLKRTLLSVPAEVLERHGAVSAEVAQAMALGIRQVTAASIGLSTTGIAGPHGATASKPVGLAYVAAVTAERALVRRHMWQGDRQANRQQSAQAALALALELLAPGKR